MPRPIATLPIAPLNDWNSRREFLRLGASLVAGATLAGAQAPIEVPDDKPTFSSSVKVVDLVATVRGKDSQFVRSLTKDDFTLLEDGRPQTIRYFSQESELPLTIGLMIDTSMSQARLLDSERSASLRFVDQVLKPKDQVFMVQFDFAILMRQRLTSSRKALENALPFLDIPSNNELRMQRGGGTLLFDAVVKASNEVLRGRENDRKAMVILSDGEDNGSEFGLSEAIEAAQKADTLIYSILFSDAVYGIGSYGADGRNAMQKLAKQTGGSYFEVSKKVGIDQIYQLIQEEMRSQYSMGFTSDRPVEISEFRTLKLTTKQKGLSVQARNRYWAKR
ncbi:MAG: VWA domain-containing protein [Acidobacteriota bacterium]